MTSRSGKPRATLYRTTHVPPVLSDRPAVSRRRIAALAAAVALAAAACGGTADPTDLGADAIAPPSASPTVAGEVATDATTPTPPPGSGSQSAAPTPAAEAPEAAVRALDFTAPALAGGEVRGADFAGRDVVLWMWAPW